MTVNELIKQLKKMPRDAVVIIKDHDQSEGEMNNYVRFIFDVSDEFPDHEVQTVAISG